VQHSDEPDLSFDICPACGSSDLVFEKVTLRFGMQTVVNGTMDALGIEGRDHENFPIIRCRSCQNVAVSRSALLEIIPALAGQDFELHQMPTGFSKSHELN
jgi:hypothetical protein